jgi:hypothetical protein
MSAPAIDKELDPTPMIDVLAEKSATGKLAWEATAQENTFVSSIGGQTLKITLEWQPDRGNEPVLYLLDGKGKTIWQISSDQTRHGLRHLYSLAQRVANRVDDRVADLMDALQRL